MWRLGIARIWQFHRSLGTERLAQVAWDFPVVLQQEIDRNGHIARDRLFAPTHLSAS